MVRDQWVGGSILSPRTIPDFLARSENEDHWTRYYLVAMAYEDSAINAKPSQTSPVYREEERAMRLPAAVWCLGSCLLISPFVAAQSSTTAATPPADAAAGNSADGGPSSETSRPRCGAILASP
jgi:hypothetical protein